MNSREQYREHVHGINCAQHVANGHVMDMNLDAFTIPGPWRMQRDSST